MKVWIYIYFPVFRNFNCRQNSYSVGLSFQPVFIRKLVFDSRPIESSSRPKRSWIFIRASFSVISSFVYCLGVGHIVGVVLFVLVWTRIESFYIWYYLGSFWVLLRSKLPNLTFMSSLGHILVFVIFNFFRIYYILHFRVSSVIKLYVHENNVMMTS